MKRDIQYLQAECASSEPAVVKIGVMASRATASCPHAQKYMKRILADMLACGHDSKKCCLFYYLNFEHMKQLLMQIMGSIHIFAIESDAKPTQLVADQMVACMQKSLGQLRQQTAMTCIFMKHGEKSTTSLAVEHMHAYYKIYYIEELVDVQTQTNQPAQGQMTAPQAASCNQSQMDPQHNCSLLQLDRALVIEMQKYLHAEDFANLIVTCKLILNVTLSNYEHYQERMRSILYYVVARGKMSGIYLKRSHFNFVTSNFPQAVYTEFNNRAAAIASYVEYKRRGVVMNRWQPLDAEREPISTFSIVNAYLAEWCDFPHTAVENIRLPAWFDSFPSVRKLEFNSYYDYVTLYVNVPLGLQIRKSGLTYKLEKIPPIEWIAHQKLLEQRKAYQHLLM